ncbi:MAG: peptidoglycan bridge formation glycyltransferase FemA/FemB family protein [Armatimonadota bacterium]|nr:peptidoglycan bridge formation glycyltransferase FemA/FemB family protein [Armatimonadota bacterium]
MDIRQISDSERDLWNSFVAGWPTGDLLQSFEWGIVKARSSGWQPVRVMAFEDNLPIAAMSILSRGHFGKSIFYAPRGPVADLTNANLLKSLTDAARDLAKARSAILLKVDPPVPVEDVQAGDTLRRVGFRPANDTSGFGGAQPRCVMQLDITPTEDQLMADFKPKTRYNIRLAEKKGVSVRQGSGKADVRKFYDLLRETAARDGFLIRGRQYFETMWELLAPVECARLFLAEYQSEAVAGALCFYLGDRCWYTYGASANSHRDVMPNHLMQWRMIRHAKSIGCRLYDFRGVSPRRAPSADDHLQGLNRFKEGFAAKYVEYVGEYDLPFSTPMYWLWRSVVPRATGALKTLKRAKSTHATTEV